MSQSSEPIRQMESDEESKHSSAQRSGKRGSSPAQSQPPQGSFSHTDPSETGVRKRAPRSITTSNSSSDSDSLNSARVPGTTPQKTSIENLKPEGGKKNSEENFPAPPMSKSVDGAGGFHVDPPVPSVPLPGSTGGLPRKGRFRQEIIRCPDETQGNVRQVRHRMPTPEPDVLERIYIKRAPAEIVEEITEIPHTPPPCIKERHEIEPAGPPQVIKRSIRVPPRGTFGGQQTQINPNIQYTDDLINPGAYGGSHQVPTNQADGFLPGNISTGGFATTGYGHVGVNPQPQPSVVFSVDAATSQVLPPLGCQPAFCFYI